MPAAPGSVRRGGVEGRGRVDKGVAGKRTEERYPSQPRPGQWGEGGGVWRGGVGWIRELLGRGQRSAILASRTRVSEERGCGGEGEGG